MPAEHTRLPPATAIQHPQDWLDAASSAVGAALDAAAADIESGGGALEVVGVGVDFTSCTVLPTCGDALQPLMLANDGLHRCVNKGHSQCGGRDRAGTLRAHAWPKLWKHHGAEQQARDITEEASRRSEAWLQRYGGVVGLEWAHPKLLEVYDGDREAFEACDTFLEGGDWLVARLCGLSRDRLVRSACQAGYKALWSADDGWPAPQLFDSLRGPGVGAAIASRLHSGRVVPPGEPAGRLASREHRARLSRAHSKGLAHPLLPEGLPVSAACIDAHAGVPGAGIVDAGTMVLVLGTSACHMVMHTSAPSPTPEGVCGVVQGGILPHLVGFETGQAAVGDAFAWLQAMTGQPLDELEQQASALPPSDFDGNAASGGVPLCVDFFNGCRSPLMDPGLHGSLHGLSLASGPAHVYRAVAEGTAMGCRRIVEGLRDGGVPVTSFVATGGLAQRPGYMQILADVLQAEVQVAATAHGPAWGAAMFGGIASGSFGDPGDPRAVERAVLAMSACHDPDASQCGPAAGGSGDSARVYLPEAGHREAYDSLYRHYLARAVRQRH